MLVYEFKIKAKTEQYQAIDEAIRIGQFLRNKCLRHWLDSPQEDKVNGFTLNKYTKVLSDNKTDSNGHKVENPRFLRKSEKKLKKLQRSLSKKKKGSNNRRKALKKLGKQHLKVSRQRQDWVIKLARCLMKSNDFVAIEDLNVKGLVKSKMAKSINDASWSLFRQWLEYFAKVFQRQLIAVSPHYTSQDCSGCGQRVKKSLSTRTHICQCGLVLCRDHNAAINILRKALDVVGHTKSLNPCGQINLWVVNENLLPKLAE